MWSSTDRVLTIVRIEQRVLRHQGVAEVWEALARMVRSPGRHVVCLDFSPVAYPTAGGLGRLVALHNALAATGGELTLVNVSPQVHEVLRVTGLTRLLTVWPKATASDSRRRPGTSRGCFIRY
jgi:anti-anti-sigma factor